MPSFIVLAQLQHCFLEGGGIHPPPVIESQKKSGLNRVKAEKPLATLPLNDIEMSFSDACVVDSLSN